MTTRATQTDEAVYDRRVFDAETLLKIRDALGPYTFPEQKTWPIRRNRPESHRGFQIYFCAFWFNNETECGIL
jgi:hypothetical protein